MAQTLLVQVIEIFDDEINEGQEVFNVSVEVLGNISNAVEFRIQTTLCRIRQSDRKLSCKICMYHVHISVFCLSAHKFLFLETLFKAHSAYRTSVTLVKSLQCHQFSSQLNSKLNSQV